MSETSVAGAVENTEKLPLSEVITVIDSVTIYKTGKWWSAVVLGDQFGHRKIFLYLWCKDPKTGEKWKRKQKSTISSEKDFNKIVEAVRKFLPQLGGAPQSPTQ